MHSKINTGPHEFARYFNTQILSESIGTEAVSATTDFDKKSSGAIDTVDFSHRFAGFNKNVALTV